MSWANKAHKRIEKQKEDEKFNQDLRNALDLFFLITADYLHRYEGYSKKRLMMYTNAILTISLSIKEETKRINVHILYKELKKQQSLSVHTWMKLFLKWKKLKKRK